MIKFASLYEHAVRRKGGEAELAELLPTPVAAATLAGIPDDRWLAKMSKSVFCAGFNWRVVDNKWPGFEEAFAGFNPVRWKFMSDTDFETLLQDTRIIRHAKKILSVRDNATFLCDLAEEHGSAGRFFADWPDDNYVGLLIVLKKRGNRLGGNTGQYFLRAMGKDSFILSQDVVAALIRENIVSNVPRSQRDLAQVQQAFNQWHAESGRPLAHISKILAFTVGV